MKMCYREGCSVLFSAINSRSWLFSANLKERFSVLTPNINSDGAISKSPPPEPNVTGCLGWPGPVTGGESLREFPLFVRKRAALLHHTHGFKCVYTEF